jgi:predicted AAA+ superfamily ATPase
VAEIHPPSGYNSTMIRRNILNNFKAALTDTSVVLVTGARQTGKSTLVKHIDENDPARKYITLDDLTTLNAAHSDPQGFIKGLNGPVIIDEIQRAPELLFPIKVAVDTNRKPGCFILTSSANILLLPKVSESLAGRIEILTLYPFAQSELMEVQQSFADVLYDSGSLKAFMSTTLAPTSLKQTIIKGGYPEIQTRTTPSRQRAWFNSYITTLIERDIKEFANIENSTDLSRLLSLLAAHSGGLSHYAELSRILEIPQTTLKRYVTLLRATHLVQIIPAWSRNFGKRVVRSPKLILNDLGLIGYLLGIHHEKLDHDPVLYGR